jgi:hypothetical protein
MNATMRFEGAAPRQRMTYHFDSVPPRPHSIDLSYLRASGLAQMRLQLAVLSGNRRGALRELDRLVEIDRKLEALTVQSGASGGIPGARLIAQLVEQRQAIATEKLALMAAVEFPRLAPAERAEDPSLAEDADSVVLEDTQFGPRLARILVWVFAFVAIGTTLAFATPLLAWL